MKKSSKNIDIPDNFGVIIETPNFSAYNNLMQLAKILRKIGRSEVREAIQRVGLNPNEKKHVRKYSLGMRQRLGLAQAIMEDPDILILGEPMNGLDKSVDPPNFLGNLLPLLPTHKKALRSFGELF